MPLFIYYNPTIYYIATPITLPVNLLKKDRSEVCLKNSMMDKKMKDFAAEFQC